MGRGIWVIAGLVMALVGPATTRPAGEGVAGFRANVDVQVTDELLIVHSDGLPDHETGVYPNEKNPYSILPQHYLYLIPRHPKWSETVTPLPPGPIGLAINGVLFYNPATKSGQDAGKVEISDDCCGHPDEKGRYHYHVYPRCIHTSFVDPKGEHSPLIGYAFDGYGIYGPNGEGGKVPTDLDACNGHWDAVRGYHYHVRRTFPYILGGYHGVVEKGNFDGAVKGPG